MVGLDLSLDRLGTVSLSNREPAVFGRILTARPEVGPYLDYSLIDEYLRTFGWL